MVPLKIALIALCLACAVIGQDVKPTDATTTEKPQTTTMSTTTEKPTTTSSSTTTPTTTTTTTTTTAKPTTTTVGPITTRAPPTPPPAPTPGEWNSTCIKVKFAAQVNFTYETTDGGKQNALFNLPPNMTVYDHLCEFNETQKISLHWLDEATKESNSITLEFNKNNTMVSLATINIKLSPNTLFPDAKNDSVQLIYFGKKLFEVPQNRSYHCTKDDKISLVESLDTKETVGYLTLSKVQMEAFHVENKENDKWSFSTVLDCEAKTGSDVVPIAVGIALCVLIVIVLISYLVARRRSAVRGYMSF